MSVYHLSVMACQAVEEPNRKRRARCDASWVIQTIADDQLLDELAFYMPLAWKAYSSYPVEIQWFTNQYPGGEDGRT